jgi:exopolysaccharide biosynthesis polyprenyl glycosylphosphotransferase
MSGTVVPDFGRDSASQAAALRRLPTAYAPVSLRSAQPAGTRQWRSPVYIELARLLDAAIVVLALPLLFIVSNAPYESRTLSDLLLGRLTVQNLIVLAGFAFIWQELFFILGLYDPAVPTTRRSEVPAVVAATLLGTLLALVVRPFSAAGELTMSATLLMWPMAAALTVGGRAALHLVLRTTPPTRVRRRVLIVGSGPRAVHLYNHLCVSPDADAELVGFVDANGHAIADEARGRMLGSLEDLEQLLMQHVIDEVLIALPTKSRYSEIQWTIEVCERVGIEAKYLADVFRCTLAGTRYDDSEHGPFVSVKVVTDDRRWVVKRAIDFAGALFGLLVLSPVLLLIAAGVKLTSPGPIFFVQERYGLRKRRFQMYKFRTMVANADRLQASLENKNEADGPVFKIKNDPRVTPLGRFLRRTSLDELPQLINVLKGDMSLVGPRPLPVRDVHLFRHGWLMRRFSVPPGLTCLWQISGRSNLGFDDWIALDLQYIDRWSLALDFEILAKTVPVVLRGTGAS